MKYEITLRELNCTSILYIDNITLGHKNIK